MVGFRTCCLRPGGRRGWTLPPAKSKFYRLISLSSRQPETYGTPRNKAPKRNAYSSVVKAPIDPVFDCVSMSFTFVRPQMLWAVCP